MQEKRIDERLMGGKVTPGGGGNRKKGGRSRPYSLGEGLEG